MASAAEDSGVFSLQPSKDYARIAGQSVWGLVFVFFVSPGRHGCARGTAAMLIAAMQKKQPPRPILNRRHKNPINRAGSGVLGT